MTLGFNGPRAPLWRMVVSVVMLAGAFAAAITAIVLAAGVMNKA